MFALKQAVDLYETYQAKIAECEEAIVKYLGTQPDVTDQEPPSGGKHVPARNASEVVSMSGRSCSS
jgi:hypothetical protein